MHADRTNRVVLILLAVLLIVGGAFACLASFNVLPFLAARSTLLDNSAASFVGVNEAWFWPVLALVALLVALVCVRWLIALMFSTDRAGDLPVRGDRSMGATTLSAAALTDAVSKEIESYSGVHAAHARIIGDLYEPELVLEVTADGDADLTALREQIERDAIAHARAAIDAPQLAVILDLAVAARRAERVK